MARPLEARSDLTDSDDRALALAADVALLPCTVTDLPAMVQQLRDLFPTAFIHGAESGVMVRGVPAREVLRAKVDLRSVEAADSQAPITIPVRYDGADLAQVSRATGLSEAEVVRVHSAALYRVAFCGFAAGFSYLVGLPEVLRMARRDVPRTRVPAGSLAIAADYCAIYPTASPGGWHLIGSCDVPMFSADRETPVTLPPGRYVRFEAV